MEIIATDRRLTSAYLRKISCYNYFAITGSILIIVVSALWMLFHIGGNHGNALFADAGYAVADFIGACWVYQTAYSARFGPVRLGTKHQLAWLFVGLGLTADGIGGAYYLYLEYIQQKPFPSTADIFFNLTYPLFFIGLLLMPTQLRFRIRMGLDTCITTLCILGVSWFLVIGPAYVNMRNQVPPSELFTALSYPTWDIVLILAIVLLIQRRAEPLLRGSLIIFGLAILSNTWADSSYTYFDIFGMYVSGTVYIDPFWMIYSLLIGISALTQHETLVRHIYKIQTLFPSSLKQSDGPQPYKYNGIRSKGWRSLSSMIIYIPLVLLLGLTVYGESFHDGEVSHVLIFITAIVGILVASRYLLATHENEVLLQEREQQHAESEHLRYLSTRLSDTLEIEQLQEQIVALAVTELAFDAAMLVLVEERKLPISPQSHLLVNTAMTTSTRAGLTTTRMSDLHYTNWHFQGNNILYHTLVDGKVAEVAWANHLQKVPQEVQLWQQESHIPALLFFPLIYQDKIVGCLGVTQRGKVQPDLHEISLMKAYTEHVTVAIEHAQLYRERREYESFARSLANIAARLNLAVVDTAEIQQLICREAACALQADYALLYIVENGEQLVPTAVSMEGHLSAAPQEEWPTISMYEHEAQALRVQQPTLLQIQPSTPQSSKVTNPLPILTTSLQHLGAQPRMPFSQPASTRVLTVPPNSRIEPRQHLSLRARLVLLFVQSIVLAPLIISGRAVGLLILARSLPPTTRDKKSFDEGSLAQVQDFVEQASVAYTNAQLYQRLHTAHRQLQELDQLKDQFMITASHELRTPLTAVQGYIELMAEYGDILPSDQRHEFLQKARRSCDELVVMLGNVMDASRLEIEAGIRQAQMERVTVQPMLNSVVELIEPQVTQQQREVHIHVPPQLAVIADAARLRQVVMNISVNALKYSPANTPLLYTARAVIDHIPWVLISITDKGNGITLQEQGKLFQRFYRLERDVNSAVRGSGLGLYISRRLIEAMGGKIWVESQGIPGEGSTFHIQLPLAQ